MKKTILLLFALSQTALAANSKTDTNTLRANLQIDLSIGRALFECVRSGNGLNQIYNETDLTERSADEQCRIAVSNALEVGATREDFKNAIKRLSIPRQ
jgi:hypothetical protein